MRVYITHIHIISIIIVCVYIYIYAHIYIYAYMYRNNNNNSNSNNNDNNDNAHLRHYQSPPSAGAGPTCCSTMTRAASFCSLSRPCCHSDVIIPTSG